jgi:hypothetical protein
VFVSQLPQAFQRLLLHTVAQYLALKSKSCTTPLGTRETVVENPRPYFVPPRTSLHDYCMAVKKKTNGGKVKK